jgi:Cu+-exporting ATPase
MMRVATNVLARVICAASLVLALGCVSSTPPAGAEDPSSANAPTAPAHGGSSVLEPDHEPLSGVSQSESADEHSHGHAHAESGVSHEHGNSQASDASESDAPLYICPMHPEVRAHQPDRCPKCGMKLELVKSEKKNDE